MNYLDSDDPIDVFFKELENLRRDILSRIKTDVDLTDEERIELDKKLAHKIFDKSKRLKDNYQ